MRIREQALKGCIRSARFLLELRAAAGAGSGEAASAAFLSAEDRAILTLVGLAAPDEPASESDKGEVREEGEP